MTKLIQINPYVFGEEAEYKEQVIQEYRNNPYIEALPLINDKKDVIEKLSNYPAFNENERDLDSQYRFHIIQRLFQYFQPLSIHLGLENQISYIIRQGYISRNPLSKKFVQVLIEGNEMIQNGNIDVIKNDTFSTTAYGLTIVGSSGMGKSVSVNRILSLYSQVIVHSKYKGIPFSQYQLVWLKVDCPHDGSIKGLSLDILLQIDNILGTNYYNSSRNLSTNAILPVVLQLVRKAGLGLLVIDEIQNLSMLKSGGAEKVLNYFLYLNNMGIPILMIGTNKAISILQSQFRQARRSVNAVFFERIKSKDEVSWRLFLEGLFDYQWVRKPVILTKEISDLMYDESQGIFDIAIKIYVMVQLKSISTKKEEITPELIRSVVKENMKLIKPMLEALKSNNINKVAQYEDIAPIDIGEFMNQQLQQISMNDKISEIQLLKKKNSKSVNTEEAVLKLLDLDITPSKAKKTVELVLNSYPEILSINEIVKRAYKIIVDSDTKEPKKVVKQEKSSEYADDDLRIIVQNGKKDKLSAYESLFNKGFIKPYLWNC